MKIRRRKAVKKLIEPRFSDCRTCAHYVYGNIGKKCRGCESGENFEEEIEELDPGQDGLFAFPGQDDDDD